MIDFTIETVIDRPVADVFAYVTDPARLATWQTNTVSAIQEDAPPLGLGSRLREVHRAPGGKELASLVEVTEYEPDRAFGLAVREGTPIDLHVTFEPAGDGTRLRLRPHGRLTGPMRLAEPLLGVVLRRQFSRDCRTLKDVLERGAAR